MENDTFCHLSSHVRARWPKLEFLNDMIRIARMVTYSAVGPDVHKTIKRWANNEEPWDMVVSTMEHQDVDSQIYHMSDDGQYLQRPPEWWDGAAPLELQKIV